MSVLRSTPGHPPPAPTQATFFEIGDLDTANKAMIRASNLTGIDNPIKWMNDGEFDKFREDENFELKMLNK